MMPETIYPDIKLPRCKSTRSTLDTLLIEVCEDHGVTAWEIRSGKRALRIVKARRDFCRRAYPSYTYKQIASYLNRDHSSIMHLVKNDN